MKLIHLYATEAVLGPERTIPISSDAAISPAAQDTIMSCTVE
jgi:hypothetical protein